MLFEQSLLFVYSDNKWDNFGDFVKYLNGLKKDKHLFFDGEGFLEIINDDKIERHYLFSINNIIYSSFVFSNNGEHFIGVLKLIDNFFKSTFFSQNQSHTLNFKKLEASVSIDCKSYNYEQEKKLVISKESKIELFYSQRIIFNEDLIEVECATTNSLISAVNRQKKVNEINERTNQLILNKNKEQ